MGGLCGPGRNPVSVLARDDSFSVFLPRVPFFSIHILVVFGLLHKSLVFIALFVVTQQSFGR